MWKRQGIYNFLEKQAVTSDMEVMIVEGVVEFAAESDKDYSVCVIERHP